MMVFTTFSVEGEAIAKIRIVNESSAANASALLLFVARKKAKERRFRTKREVEMTLIIAQVTRHARRKKCD